MGIFSRPNKQVQKSVAKPEPVDPWADVKKTLLSSSSASEGKAARTSSSLAVRARSSRAVRGALVVAEGGRIACSILAPTKVTSKQATTEQWSWLPRVFQKRSCSAPKRARASSSRKRSRSVPKNSDAQHKQVLEAKPACTPWRPIDDFEAAACGDTEAMLELLPNEASEAVPIVAPQGPDSLPVNSAADVPVSNVTDVPPCVTGENLPVRSAADKDDSTVANVPPIFSSCRLWQCMAPSTDHGSELHVA